MEPLNAMIKSGDYKLLLDAVKGFRNGFVYGCKVRAPHALVMTLLWSRGPPMQMATKIFNATKQHGMNLAKFAFVFKLLYGVLGKVTGGSAAWHSVVLGALCGFLFWGDNSPVNVQVNMYILSRILSGFAFLWMQQTATQLPPAVFRLYAAVMWACVMFLFYHHAGVLQTSLQSSMTYIYRESDKYSSVRDLIVYNK